MRALFLLLAAAVSGALAAVPAPAAPSDDDRSYIIGVEDLLYVWVFEDKNIQLEVRVRPDGMISLPMIGDVKAEGLTPARLSRVIAEKLEPFFENPNVAVIVKEINSFKVYVLGEVNRQGVLSFYQPTTLLQAIAAAGGLTAFANEKMTLIRQSEGGAEWIKIDCSDLLAGKPTADNIYLRPGDVLLFHR
ncbi:MAG: sugar ABC transporter substrate-binding protein [Acidobacteria bacterium]|nr:MAG: sugar ABC transporter substrate-binding protein [Acidobacteriota bacterium]